MEFIKGLH